ncbi:hypothetical protein B5S28_g1291 [[Candida] boidinii]|nr:hypothetical protein B5S28_g1291 [[Candida] boidinii]OWB70862.1 hypothetical protein B5S31_g543 [[Candida] boidinii]OWB76751.1 hypothetical protein B5S32_g906 [[Candida] boidinii]
MHLENEKFLSTVLQLLEGNKKSVFITQKRLTPQPDGVLPKSDELDDLPIGITSDILDTKTDTETYPVLIRVTNGKDKKGGKKSKTSTIVQPEDLEKFWSDYSNLLKSVFVGLKKKEKKKKNKKSKGKVTK